MNHSMSKGGSPDLRNIIRKYSENPSIHIMDELSYS